MSDPAADDDAVPDGLPPADGDPDDGEGAVGDDGLSDFRQGLSGETDGDLDDATAADLDVGIEVAQPTDASAGGEPPDELDIGEMIGTTDEAASYADDDDGPTHFDVSTGIASMPELDVDDDAVGADEDAGYLVSDELPSLDADDDDDARPEENWELDTTDQEDELPPAADPAWLDRHPGGGPWRPCVALVVDPSRSVAGGAELYVLAAEHDEPTEMAHEAGRVHSLALVGADRDTLLCATVIGQLARYSPLPAPPEICTSWRDAAGLPATAPGVLELAPGPQQNGTVLARTSTGLLLRSSDEGLTWERVDLGGKCLALSATGAPALALAEGRSGSRLYRSDDGGSSWTAIELRRAAARTARGDAPQLVGHGDVVALGARNRGTLVSCDGGETFTRVVGVSGTTCLAAGLIDDAPAVWAALYRELDDESTVCVIDPRTATARRIATVRGPGETDSRIDDGDDASEVCALGWEPSAQYLWAAGGFGLLRWSPPDRA